MGDINILISEKVTYDLNWFYIKKKLKYPIIDFYKKIKHNLKYNKTTQYFNYIWILYKIWFNKNINGGK